MTQPSWFDWLTVLAIAVGPIAAVFVTRWVDRQRAAEGRRLEIFKTLMRTRRSTTSPEHVGALNLVEIEFAGEADVLTRWRELFAHFGGQQARRMDETPQKNDPPDAVQRKDEAFWRRVSEERQTLLAKLLHAIARSLHFKIEQLEIFQGGYLPQGWVDQEQQGNIARQYILDIALGHRSLPVTVYGPVEPSQPDSHKAV